MKPFAVIVLASLATALLPSPFSPLHAEAWAQTPGLAIEIPVSVEVAAPQPARPSPPKKTWGIVGFSRACPSCPLQPMYGWIDEAEVADNERPGSRDQSGATNQAHVDRVGPAETSATTARVPRCRRIARRR